MAEERIAVLDMLRKATADGNVDVLREGVRVLPRRSWRPRSQGSPA
jgi:hypothetical protein